MNPPPIRPYLGNVAKRRQTAEAAYGMHACPDRLWLMEYNCAPSACLLMFRCSGAQNGSALGTPTTYVCPNVILLTIHSRAFFSLTYMLTLSLWTNVHVHGITGRRGAGRDLQHSTASSCPRKIRTSRRLLGSKGRKRGIWLNALFTKKSTRRRRRYRVRCLQ